jgi:DNA-binding transcriptional MerR regulator
MYSLNHLKDILGVSKPTLYNRLKQFDKFIRNELRTGNHNEIFITENGRKILERIESLRKDMLPIKQIKSVLEQELSKSGKESSEQQKTDPQPTYETVQLLKEQIAYLKSQIEKKDDLIERLSNRIKELTGMLQLPSPKQTPVERKGFIRRVWEKIW